MNKLNSKYFKNFGISYITRSYESYDKITLTDLPKTDCDRQSMSAQFPTVIQRILVEYRLDFSF